MKKITTLAMIISLTIGVNGQSLLPKKYGIKVGTNIANISSTTNEGSKEIESSALIGIAGGFYMEIPLNDKWYINPELIYIQKGASFSYDYTHMYEINKRDEYTTNNTLKLDYVELNPTISYKSSNRLSLDIGPSFSFLINEDYAFSEILTQSTNSDTTTAPIGLYESESLDIGLNIGISIYLSKSFIVSWRTSTGFMSIGKAEKTTDLGSTTNTPKINTYDLKNRGHIFFITYLF